MHFIVHIPVDHLLSLLQQYWTVSSEMSGVQNFIFDTGGYFMVSEQLLLIGNQLGTLLK